jgi:endonuclease III
MSTTGAASCPSVHQVAKALKSRYQDHGHFNQVDPLDELIYIIISTRTREHRYRPAYSALRSAYPTNALLANADPKNITDTLTATGLADFKTKTILQSLQYVYNRFGTYDLNLLHTLDDNQCEAILTAIPGVGLKIARCVLMCSLNRQVFPVDINVWRVAKRLKWILSRQRYANSNQMNQLQDFVPPDLRYSLHVNLLSLGRDACIPGRPRCEECVIKMICPTYLDKNIPPIK